MSEWVGDKFRKVSWVLLLVGGLTTFYALAFADVPTGRGGRPKPPLGWQLFQTGLVVAAGVPGVTWSVVRAVQGRQRTFWD
jgi:hypothetical protein